MDAAPPISNLKIRPPPPTTLEMTGCQTLNFLPVLYKKNPKASFSVVTKKLSQYNKPLHNKLFGIMSNFPHPSNSKIYKKEPQYNETSL